MKGKIIYFDVGESSFRMWTCCQARGDGNECRTLSWLLLPPDPFFHANSLLYTQVFVFGIKVSFYE
jgi:hypothetical protein